LVRDFSGIAPPMPVEAGAESKHYKIVTLPIPKDVVLEVGGLAMRPDGKLLACTRRGEVWLISNPNTDDLTQVKFKLFATGLHEALGLRLVGKDLYVAQRPELTKLVDTDGDDVADLYETVCDRWGVSGDYHEFAFGPARDKDGNFYVTLNVGFGGGHQSKAPWRGWGSVGGKPYGLQRLVYTGVLPFEIHQMKLTSEGFDLTFTKPLNVESAKGLNVYNLESFTHHYWGTYGSPEMDHKAEKIQAVSVSADGKQVSLKVSGFRPGRIYELHLDGVKSAEGDALLHPVGYYTLNEIPK
jgi:hypothetical protein